MQFRSLVSAFVGLSALLTVSSVNAATTGFVNSPSTNSSDWAASVGSLGKIINSNVNFDAMSTGALNGIFYNFSDGVTIAPSGDFGSVTFGAGPNQGNTGGAISGEGKHAASNFLTMGPGTSSLTFNFNRLVFGAGIFTLDVFQNSGLQIEAFTGLDRTGTSLGVFSAVSNNFQQNNLYFMGLTSDIGFRSFVFRDTLNNGGDVFGVDDFVFAVGKGIPTVPLPAAGWLLLAGLGGLGVSSWKRKRVSA